MRPIRFRGKDLIGQWRYGIPDFQPDGYCEMISRDNQGFSRAVVLPRTVGQFTGFQDKRGKDIYEDDIVLHKISQAQQGVDRVLFLQEQGAWGFQGGYQPFNDWSCAECDLFPRLEVIGNIHDTPELLQKGGAQ